MQNYFFLEVVEAQWSDLQKELLAAKSFGEMLDRHAAFVSKLTQHCFVEERQKVITSKFIHLLQLAMELVSLCISLHVEEDGDDAPEDLFLDEDEVQQLKKNSKMNAKTIQIMTKIKMFSSKVDQLFISPTPIFRNIFIRFNTLEAEFEICRDWLMRVLAQLDGNTTGFCRPLFERLNYNRYYIQ